MRRYVILLVCLAMALGMSTVVRAGEYPERAVKIVVASGPGVPADVMMRVLAQGLTEILGQTFFIENQPGGLGLPGTGYALRQESDGYTLLAGHNANFGINLELQKTPPYDPMASTPIGFIARYPMALVVPYGSPIKTLADLVKIAKTNPGKLNWGFGNSTGQLGGVVLNRKANVVAEGIPYTKAGEGAVVNELIAGRIDYGILLGPTAHPQTDGEKPTLRALAIFAEKRSAFFPGTPTTSELGFPGIGEMEPILFLAGPKGLPQEVVLRLFDGLKKVLERPEVLARFAAYAATPYVADGKAVKIWIPSHRELVKKIIDDNDIPRNN